RPPRVAGGGAAAAGDRVRPGPRPNNRVSAVRLGIIGPMSLKMNGFWSTAVLVALAVGLSAQAPPTPPASPKTGQTQDKPTFRVQVDLVTNDVVVKDDRGNFVPTLTKDDFEIYEDGVKQDIASMELIHGGRATNMLAPPPAPPPEGIILPPVRQTNS